MITSDHQGKTERNVGDGGDESASEVEEIQEGKIATQGAKEA